MMRLESSMLHSVLVLLALSCGVKHVSGQDGMSVHRLYIFYGQ